MKDRQIRRRYLDTHLQGYEWLTVRFRYTWTLTHWLSFCRSCLWQLTARTCPWATKSTTRINSKASIRSTPRWSSSGKRWTCASFTINKNYSACYNLPGPLRSRCKSSSGTHAGPPSWGTRSTCKSRTAAPFSTLKTRYSHLPVCLNSFALFSFQQPVHLLMDAFCLLAKLAVEVDHVKVTGEGVIPDFLFFLECTIIASDFVGFDNSQNLF